MSAALTTTSVPQARQSPPKSLLVYSAAHPRATTGVFDHSRSAFHRPGHQHRPRLALVHRPPGEATRRCSGSGPLALGSVPAHARRVRTYLGAASTRSLATRRCTSPRPFRRLRAHDGPAAGRPRLALHRCQRPGFHRSGGERQGFLVDQPRSGSAAVTPAGRINRDPYWRTCRLGSGRFDQSDCRGGIKKGGRSRPLAVAVALIRRSRQRLPLRWPRPRSPFARRPALRLLAVQSPDARSRPSLPWPCEPRGKPCQYQRG